ncbi:16480_t:CDS:1, partial [Funneliformis mosseae]
IQKAPIAFFRMFQRPLKKKYFGPQYEGILNGSIPYRRIQPTATTNSQGEFAQGGSEICFFCNEPDPLFKLNGANLELVVKLSWLHNFHLRCIIIFLKKDTSCSRCQQLIYLGEEDDARLNPKEEDRVKKFFKELSNRPQDSNLLLTTNVKTVNPTTPDM